MSKQRVLILCTGNSARSQMAEGLLRKDAGDRFEAFSAGIEPSHVRPLAIQAMREVGIDISAQRSKSVDEFSGEEFDYVITVCDNARETCPIWPGQPIVAHWGVDDPAAFVGSAQARERLFHSIALTLYRRLQLFTALPLRQLDRLRLEQVTRDIGRDLVPQESNATGEGALR